MSSLCNYEENQYHSWLKNQLIKPLKVYDAKIIAKIRGSKHGLTEVHKPIFEKRVLRSNVNVSCEFLDEERMDSELGDLSPISTDHTSDLIWSYKTVICEVALFRLKR